MSAPLLPPLGDLVACAWARAVLGLTADSVGTTLPPVVDPNTGTARPWASTGFVTCRIVGGGGTIGTTPMRRNVVQFDAYAVHVTENGGVVSVSGRPQWNLANLLAEGLWRSAVSFLGHGAPPGPLTLRPEYATATVQDATALNAPRRVPGDPGRHARYTLDVALSWVPNDWMGN